MKQILATIGVVAAWATTAMADTTLDPDVVLYYDFETMASGGVKVVNIANPRQMELEGVGNSSPVEASPATKIRQSLTSVYLEDSAKALGTTWTSDDAKAYRYFLPTENWFAITNFTIEFFYKTAGDVATYTPLFRRGGGNNVQINIGVGEVSNKLKATVLTGEGSYSAVHIHDDATTSDGEWHHAALVVSQTGETKTMRLYRDYVRKGELALSANVTADNTANKVVTLAGRSDGNCFNGWMDSVRVTLRALEPEEFLTTRKYPTDATITHVSFEDGTANADADKYGALTDGTLYSLSGATAPSFSDDVPGYDILDGEGGEVLLHKNGKSISFPSGASRSYVTYGLPSLQGKMFDTYYLATDANGVARPSGTVEFWMKSEDTTYSDDPMFVRFINGSKDVWRFRFSSNKLRLHFANTSDGWYTIDADENVLDGKWHHVAFTFAPRSGDEGKTDVKLYVDYGTPKTVVMASGAKMNYVFDSSSPIQLQVGNTWGANGYHGLVDELRFADQALSPSQFLRATHAPGLTIVVR